MSNWDKLPDYQDFHGHGTHIAGILLKDTCKEVELTSCKYFDLSHPDNSMWNTINCFKRALTQHFDVINYSSGGSAYSDDEIKILKQIKSIIVVAAGNDNQDLSWNNYYPASYRLPNVIAVGNLDGNKKSSTSNYGLPGMVWEQGTFITSTFPGGRFGIMSGSSQATALHSNKLLKEMCEKK